MKANKKRRSRLAVKMLLTFFGLAVAVIMAATLAGAIILNGVDKETQIKAMYIAGVIELAALSALFIAVTGRLIVKRITALNEVVSKTAEGEYGLHVPERGNDEITELSASFNNMSAELKANAFLSKDFARYVSHEFKTPLSVIKSYAEAVQMNSADDETRGNMAIIISETDRLADMSRTLLEFCRLDSTTLVPKDDVFSPAAQIRDILIGTQLGWSAKNIDVDPELEEFTVQGNEKLSYHIWKNLIDNAVKFTDSGGHIKIALKKEGGTLFFSVADDGCGIAEADEGKIFDLFFTGDRSRNKEGSGLGLPLVKKIVEKLGGDIGFESARGRGTTFTVRLPLQ